MANPNDVPTGSVPLSEAAARFGDKALWEANEAARKAVPETLRRNGYDREAKVWESGDEAVLDRLRAHLLDESDRWIIAHNAVGGPSLAAWFEKLCDDLKNAAAAPRREVENKLMAEDLAMFGIPGKVSGVYERIWTEALGLRPRFIFEKNQVAFRDRGGWLIYYLVRVAPTAGGVSAASKPPARRGPKPKVDEMREAWAEVKRSGIIIADKTCPQCHRLMLRQLGQDPKHPKHGYGESTFRKEVWKWGEDTPLK